MTDIALVPDKVAATTKAIPSKPDTAQPHQKAQGKANPSDTSPAVTGSNATPATTTQPAQNTSKSLS